MLRRAIGLAVCLGSLVFATSTGASGFLIIKPSPVNFGGVKAGDSKTIKVEIFNDTSTEARPRASISSGTTHFSVNGATFHTCPTIQRHKSCDVEVTYRNPSSQSHDLGTLAVKDILHPSVQRSAQLTGHRLDTNPPTCTMITARNQKIIKQVKKNGKKVLKRTPFKVGLTSSKDGEVSAQATGKTSDNKSIQLEPASSGVTGGNGVQLHLKLKKASEELVIADIKKNLEPTMKLTASCTDDDGNFKQVHAVIHFHDKASGTKFKYPLIADPRTS